MHSERDALMVSAQRRAMLKCFGSAALLGALLRGVCATANEIRLGEMAPAARLTTLDGQVFSTQKLLGHVVVLTFWATWCVPCREELPLLSRYAEQHRADGLQILGFSLDSPEELAQVRHVAESLSFPVGLLANSAATGYGRIWRLPVNFTIDRSGRLVNDGWKEKKPAWTPERLEQIVTPLLQSRVA